jgi:hypothetical protein
MRLGGARRGYCTDYEHAFTIARNTGISHLQVEFCWKMLHLGVAESWQRHLFVVEALSLQVVFTNRILLTTVSDILHTMFRFWPEALEES